MKTASDLLRRATRHLRALDLIVVLGGGALASAGLWGTEVSRLLA